MVKEFSSLKLALRIIFIKWFKIDGYFSQTFLEIFFS